MKKTLLLVSSLIALLFTGCSSNDSDNKTNAQKAVLNISDANSLVVLENAGSGKKLTTETNLFKILSDGSYIPLNFTNKDGSIITAPVVSNILNLNTDYILLSGIFNISDTSGSAKNLTDILVRKSDGAIYNFSPFNFSYQKRLGETIPKTDAEGNIYYYEENYSVGKLSLSNPDNITKTDYLPTGQSTEAFEVDSKGNCMYRYGESKGVTNSNGTKDIRIRKANGGIYEVKIDGRDNTEFWLGSNGYFYLITYTWDNGYKPQIHKINIDGDNISTTVVWPRQFAPYYPEVGNMFRTRSQGSYIIKKEKSVVFIDTYFNWGDMNWEFYEDDNTVETIELPHIEQGAKIVCSKENYYIATKTDLYKVNLENHEYKKLLNSGEYEIYKLNVDNNDKVHFSALRLKDGKKIFAEINKEEIFKTMNEEINKKAIVIERIDK